MKTKAIILVIFTLFMTISYKSTAQEVEWGKIQSAPSKDFNPSIIGEDEKYYYAYNLDKKGVTLRAISKKNYSEKYAETIELKGMKIDKRPVTFEKFALAGDQIIFFVSIYDKKEDASEIYAYQIKKKTGKISGSEELVLSIPARKKRERGRFGVLSSKDGSRVLVHHFMYDGKKEKYFDRYVLLNEKLKTEESKMLEFDKGTEFSISDIKMDDEGSVYALMKLGDVVTLMTFEVLRGYEKWEEKIEVDFKDQYASVQDINLSLDNDGNLVLIGSYVTSDIKAKKNKTKIKDTQLAGAFYLRLDRVSKEVVVSKVSKFDQEFLDSFATEKQLAKNKKKKSEAEAGLTNVRFLFEEDGGVVYVGEYYRYQPVYDSDGNLMGERFYYNDLVVMHFEGDGKLEWVQRVPKKQLYGWSIMPVIGGLGFITTSNGIKWNRYGYEYLPYYGFTGGISNDKVYLAFNDRIENTLTTSINAKLKLVSSLNKAVPVFFEIDLETGAYIKKSMVELATDNLWFKPGFSYQSPDDEELLIMGQKKKKFKYGKVDFN